MVTFHTNFGVIKLQLFADKAPKTVENFKSYVAEGFYDGTIFHRVIDGFMIQGGGFTQDMEQKETKGQIQNEADNGVANKKGTIAMARTNDPHSATCQFFINVADNSFLNFSGKNASGWGYCVFGEVVEGMDVIEKIRTVATGRKFGHADVPVENVILEKAELHG